MPSSKELVKLKVPLTGLTIEGFREELFEELGFPADQCTRLNVEQDFLDTIGEEFVAVVGKDPGEVCDHPSIHALSAAHPLPQFQ